MPTLFLALLLTFPGSLTYPAWRTIQRAASPLVGTPGSFLRRSTAPGAASGLFENDYVAVHKNAAPCAAAAQKCGDRIIGARSDLPLSGKPMKRSDVSCFPAPE